MKDESEWVTVRNTHEPIITQELWDKVREVEKSVSQGRKTKKGYTHPLSGFLYCADCGGKMKMNSIGRNGKVDLILHKTDGGCEIYEVKSSTDIHNVYLWDVAYQRWVLEQSGLKIVHTYIVYINNKYVRQADIDVYKLFAVNDVSESILPYSDEVAANTARAKEYITQKNEPESELGEQCFAPYECAYWQYCARDLPSLNVLDLYRISAKKAFGYMEEGIVTFGDTIKSGIPLNATQRRQVEFEQLQLPTHIDRLGIKSFLDTLWYPLYFLDFETFQTCIPMYDGIRPYQQVPFAVSVFIALSRTGRSKAQT